VDDHKPRWCDQAKAGMFDAMVISGSAASVIDQYQWLFRLSQDLREVTALGIPTLGICFGHQILAHIWGGKVAIDALGYKIRKICTVFVSDTPRARPLLPANGSQTLEVLSSHRDQVIIAPPNWQVIANSTECPIQAMVATDLPITTVQWHPEADRAFIESNPHPDWSKLDPNQIASLSGHAILPNFLNI
jgi:GMP synthase (glutamine-hydrolysing)